MSRSAPVLTPRLHLAVRPDTQRPTPSRQMRLGDPWPRLCVRSVLPGQVFLAALVATDIRERFRGVCLQLLYKDPRRLAHCSVPVPPYFSEFVQCPDNNPNTGPSSRFHAPLKWRAATLFPVIVKSPSNTAEIVKIGLFAGIATVSYRETHR